MASGTAITALILSILAVVLLIILFVLAWQRWRKFENGVPYQVQVGANTVTDVFDMTKYNYYQVGYAGVLPNNFLTLSFNLPSSINSGQTYVINNVQPITIVNLTVPTGVTFTWPPTSAANTIVPGQAIWITFTSSTAAVVISTFVSS